AAIARQTGTSVVIADRTLAARRVSAIRGSLTAAEAVQRLARACGARAVRVGATGWRLVEAEPEGTTGRSAPARPARAETAARAAPPPEGPGTDIVVIGSKRDVPLADYAGQAALIDGEVLVFGGVGGTDKVMQRVPTVASTYL